MSTCRRSRMSQDHGHGHGHVDDHGYVLPSSFEDLDQNGSSYNRTSLRSYNDSNTDNKCPSSHRESKNDKNNNNNNNGGRLQANNFVSQQQRLMVRETTTLEFNGSRLLKPLENQKESLEMFLLNILEEDIAATSNEDNLKDDGKSPNTIKHLRLRNVVLSSQSKQQQSLLIKVLSTINNGRGLESLTLSNVSSSSSSTSSSSSSTSTGHKDVLDCDFLLASNVKVENLTIERCRFETESSAKLGRAVAECQVQNFKMYTVSFVTTTTKSNNGYDSEMTGQLFGEGLGLAGSTLKTIEIRHVTTCDGTSHKYLISNLFKGLRSCTMLEKLHLEGCGLGSEDASNASGDHDDRNEHDGENTNRNDVRQLTYLVKSLQKLDTLNLYQNNINGSELGSLLSCGISGHPCLNKLVLSQNPIGDDGAKHLASFLSAKSKAVSHNTTISSLSIVDCDIWSPGCIELIKCLAVNSTIENLDVDDEWESHLKELETALATNMTLKYLSTPQSPTQNRTIDDEWKMIEYYLRLNRAKRRILVAEPCLPRSLWSIVMGQRSNDPDIAFHLIRQRPEILE